MAAEGSGIHTIRYSWWPSSLGAGLGRHGRHALRRQDDHHLPRVVRLLGVGGAVPHRHPGRIRLHPRRASLGAALVVGLPEVFRGLANARMLVFGAGHDGHDDRPPAGASSRRRLRFRPPTSSGAGPLSAARSGRPARRRGRTVSAPRCGSFRASRKSLRRPDGRERRLLRRAGGERRRPHRSERRRQDHRLQPHHREPPAGRGDGPLRRALAGWGCPPTASWQARHRPHLPEHPPLPQLSALENVLAGATAGRAVGLLAAMLPPPRRQRREERAAVARRPGRARLRGPLRARAGAGPEPRLRRPAPAGDRPGPGHRSRACSSSTSRPAA